MRELFVYYRVRADKATSARRAVLSLLDGLRLELPDLQARLLVKSDAPGDLQTWMEHYAAPDRPAGIDAGLEATIALRAAPLAGSIDGPRHTEAFDAGPGG
jgi:hypothetical protein